VTVTRLTAGNVAEVVSVLINAFHDYTVMRYTLGVRQPYEARLPRLVVSRNQGRVSPAAGFAVMTLAVLTACSGSARRAGGESGASAVRQSGRDTLASGLRPGLRLVYASGATEQPAWTVDSVTHGVAVAQRQGCARIVLRTRHEQPAPEVRLVCRGGDTLFAWNAAAGELRVQRPVGAGMSIALPQANGGTVRYETGDVGEATVSGRTFGFVHTTVTTHDASGRVVRRLRERYAIALATALDGVFEVPDPAATSGWREAQRFVLARVE